VNIRKGLTITVAVLTVMVMATRAQGPTITTVTPDGAPVAVPFVPPTATLDCTPPSGTLFPLGVTQVSCTASATLAVDVQPSALSLEQLPDLVLSASPGATSAVATFGIPVVTGGVPPHDIVFDVLTGSAMPIGTTVVNYFVTDDWGQYAGASFAVTVAATPQALLQPSDLVYQGAFRVPGGAAGDPHGNGFGYVDSGLAYNPAKNSLFLNGHIYWQLTGEISIPAVVNSTSLTSLKTASLLQPLSDITEGHLANILTGGAATRSPRMGGLLVSNGKLLGTSYEYYDANNQARLSHFTSGLTLTQAGDFAGMYQVGPATHTGFLSGYMVPIPAAWQSAFGGPALTGNCCIGITSRTSWGPAASVFDPARLGTTTPLAVTPLVEYPSTNPLVRYVDGIANTLFEEGDTVTGLVWPEGTRSVLFVGTHGTGPFCYGSGTPDPNLDHTLVPGSTVNHYCYDPVYTAKGSHSYPYAHYVWAYDANDLLSVKQGRLQPWAVKPYATWTLPELARWSVPKGYAGVQGAAYDPMTKRLFISTKKSDGTAPVIHVFKVAGDAALGVK